MHYTIYPTPLTKERIRSSLWTKDISVARERRDNLFRSLARQLPPASRFVEQPDVEMAVEADVL
jgi:hypothetical protein